MCVCESLMANCDAVSNSIFNQVFGDDDDDDDDNDHNNDTDNGSGHMHDGNASNAAAPTGDSSLQLRSSLSLGSDGAVIGASGVGGGGGDDDAMVGDGGAIAASAGGLSQPPPIDEATDRQQAQVFEQLLQADTSRADFDALFGSSDDEGDDAVPAPVDRAAAAASAAADAAALTDGAQSATVR